MAGVVSELVDISGKLILWSEVVVVVRVDVASLYREHQALVVV